MALYQDIGRIMPLPKGEYNESIKYDILDIVSYNGESYISRKQNNGYAPDENSDYWMKLIDKQEIINAVLEQLQSGQ